MEPIDGKVESLCATILNTDTESWEIRNKAMLTLTEIVSSYGDEEQHVLDEIFTASVFRLLKEPVKNMVSTRRLDTT